MLIKMRCLMTKPTNDCAPSVDSDQPGHPPSLIRVFAVRMKKAWVISYPLSASEDSDQTGRMLRLIRVFAWLTSTLLVLSWGGRHVDIVKFSFCLISHKVDEKAIICNWYNWIPHPAPDTKSAKEHKQLRRHKVKQHKRKTNRTALSQQMATRLF